MAGTDSVTAVFAANDQIAIGLLLALHEGGRRVPDDVSVVGFDDQPESAYLLPPLTTVRQNFAELGERAVESIIAAIADAPAEPPGLLTPELIVRRSTAPCRDTRRGGPAPHA